MDRTDSRVALWLFLTLSCLYMLTGGGHFYASDDTQKLAVLVSFFEKGTFAIPGGWATGLGGHLYSWFPLGASIVMLPGYLLGKLVALLVPGMPAEYVMRFAVSLENAFFSAGLVALAFVYLRWLGRSLGASAFVALALGGATMIWPYAKTSWSEPSTVFFAFAGMIAAHIASSKQLDSRWLALAGAGVAAAAFIRQELGLMAVGIGAWLLLHHWRQPGAIARALAIFAAPMVVVVGLSLWYNQARYGAILALPNYTMPQENLGVGSGRLFWAFGNLLQYTVNPNQGVLWFSPPVLLGLWGFRRFWKAHPGAAQLIAVTVVPLTFFYVYAWGLSSWAWGLRFAYVLVPLLILPAAMFWEAGWKKRLAVAVVFLGVGVQLLGVFHNPVDLYERELARTPGLTIQTLMSEPDHSPIWLAIHDMPQAVAGAVELVARGPGAAADVAAYREARQQLPDWWGFLLLLTPLPRWLVAAGTVGLLAALGLSGWKLVESLQSPSPAMVDPANSR